MQMLSEKHTRGDFASWIFQEGFLAHCSHQTLSFSHLNKISPMGDAAISSFHPSLNPKLPEAMRQLISQERDQLRSNISPQMWWDAVALCNRLVLVWSHMPPAATKVPSSSWGPEP